MTHQRGNWGGRHLASKLTSDAWGPRPSEIPPCACPACTDLDVAVHALALARWRGTATTEDRLQVRRLGRRVDIAHRIGERDMAKKQQPSTYVARHGAGPAPNRPDPPPPGPPRVVGLPGVPTAEERDRLRRQMEEAVTAYVHAERLMAAAEAVTQAAPGIGQAYAQAAVDAVVPQVRQQTAQATAEAVIAALEEAG